MSLSVINRGRLILALAVVVLTLAATATGQVTDRDRFQLFDYCRPMSLVVEQLPPDAAGIGLTEQSIQNLVESRLRSARLYDTNRPLTYLYVNVNVVGRAIGIELEFVRSARVLETDIIGLATTWDSGTVGLHGRDARFILTVVSGLMDKFLVEYLRVNAC